jgi:hypothetical protein
MGGAGDVPGGTGDVPGGGTGDVPGAGLAEGLAPGGRAEGLTGEGEGVTPAGASLMTIEIRSPPAGVPALVFGLQENLMFRNSSTSVMPSFTAVIVKEVNEDVGFVMGFVKDAAVICSKVAKELKRD